MVTLSKKITIAALLSLSLGLLVPKMAHADTVPDLFNTGVDASGNVLPDGTSPDPHYTIISGIDGSITAATLVHPGSPFYIAASTTSTYIQAVGQTTLGDYDYQTSFTLPAGATNLVITGGVAVDNGLHGVLINGINVGPYAATPGSLVNLTIGNSNAFTNLNPISVTIGDAFLLTGTNTITFLVDNDPGTNTSFRLDSVVGTYTPDSSHNSPEPMSLSLLAVGASTLLLRRRKA